jgi:hypothetical protein
MRRLIASRRKFDSLDVYAWIDGYLCHIVVDIVTGTAPRTWRLVERALRAPRVDQVGPMSAWKKGARKRHNPALPKTHPAAADPHT